MFSCQNHVGPNGVNDRSQQDHIHPPIARVSPLLNYLVRSAAPCNYKIIVIQLLEPNSTFHMNLHRNVSTVTPRAVFRTNTRSCSLYYLDLVEKWRWNRAITCWNHYGFILVVTRFVFFFFSSSRIPALGKHSAFRPLSNSNLIVTTRTFIYFLQVITYPKNRNIVFNNKKKWEMVYKWQKEK